MHVHHIVRLKQPQRISVDPHRMASGGSQLWKLDLTTSRRWKGRCFDAKLKRNPLWTDPSYAWVCEAQLGEVGGSEREHHRSFLTAMSSVAFDIRLWPVKYWTCDCFTDMDFRGYGHHKYLSALKASTTSSPLFLSRTRFLHKQTLSQAKNVFPCCISHTMKRESLETSGMTAEHKPRGKPSMAVQTTFHGGLRRHLNQN